MVAKADTGLRVTTNVTVVKSQIQKEHMVLIFLTLVKHTDYTNSGDQRAITDTIRPACL